MRGAPPSLAALALLLSACFGQWSGVDASETSGSLTTADASSGSSASGTSGAPVTSSSSSSSSSSGSSTSSGEDASAPTTTGGPACDHLDVLFVVDVSMSMFAYSNGLTSTLVSLGSPSLSDSLFAQVEDFNVAITLNAPVLGNADAAPPDSAPEADCTQLGSLLRGSSSCPDAFITSDDQPLSLSLGCLAAELSLEGDEVNEVYETARTLDALAAVLNSHDGMNEDLQACNAGFHEPGDPLLVIVIADSEDASSMMPVADYVFPIISSQGANDIDNVGFLLITAPGDGCGSEPTTSCDAEAVCRLEAVLEIVLNDRDEQLRSIDLCRAHADARPDGRDLAADVGDALLGLYATICD